MYPTLPEDPSPREYKREKWFDRLTQTLVFAVVALGAIGLLGVKTSTANGSGSGFWMEVTHATVSRGGLATPFAIEVGTEDDSALPSVITLRVTSDYLALFDDNGMEPAPVNSFNSGNFTTWDFEVPQEESTLEVVLDARLEPAVQWGEAASVELWVEGEMQAATEFRSWVMP